MFGLQPTDVLIIIAVALFLFLGPSKLPEIGRALGRTIREFQSATKDTPQAFQDGLKETKKDEPPKT